MVRPGRGAAVAQPGGGLPWLPTPFPLPLSAPCLLGGDSAPRAVPSTRGTAGLAPSSGVAGRGERGLAWRGKAGWCWGCWRPGRGSPRGQRQQSQGRVRSMGCHQERPRGTGLTGRLPCPTGGSHHGQQGRAGSPQGRGRAREKEGLIHPRGGQEAQRGQGGQPAAGRAASHLCRARPPLSRLSCGRGAASSAGASSSSSLSGAQSSLGARRSSASKPWSGRGAQALHGPEARCWGVPWTWGPPGTVDASQPASVGSTLHRRNPAALLPLGLAEVWGPSG